MFGEAGQIVKCMQEAEALEEMGGASAPGAGDETSPAKGTEVWEKCGGWSINETRSEQDVIRKRDLGGGGLPWNKDSMLVVLLSHYYFKEKKERREKKERDSGGIVTRRHERAISSLFHQREP